MFRERDPQVSLWQSEFLVPPKKANGVRFSNCLRKRTIWFRLLVGSGLGLAPLSKVDAHCISRVAGPPRASGYAPLALHLLVRLLVGGVCPVVIAP